MRVQFLLIFLLLFNSCSESKKIEVFEVDLLENIEKYIPIQKVNNYTINNEYCGKNKKYSCLNIYNSSNIFNNKNFDLVFISYDNSNKKVQAIAQLKTIKSGELRCAESKEETINQFKSYNKINLNDKNITTNKNKLINKDKISTDLTSYYFKKENYIFSLSCYDYTQSTKQGLPKYIFSTERKTREYNDHLADAKNEIIIDKK